MTLFLCTDFRAPSDHACRVRFIQKDICFFITSSGNSAGEMEVLQSPTRPTRQTFQTNARQREMSSKCRVGFLDPFYSSSSVIIVARLLMVPFSHKISFWSWIDFNPIIFPLVTVFSRWQWHAQLNAPPRNTGWFQKVIVCLEFFVDASRFTPRLRNSV